MQAGQLRQVVTIQRKVETQTTSGAVTWTWEDFATDIRARIDRQPFDRNVDEKLPNVVVQGEADTQITIRWRPGVTEMMQVVHMHETDSSPQEFTYYDIIGVVHVLEKRRDMILFCKTRGLTGFRE